MVETVATVEVPLRHLVGAVAKLTRAHKTAVDELRRGPWEGRDALRQIRDVQLLSEALAQARVLRHRANDAAVEAISRLDESWAMYALLQPSATSAAYLADIPADDLDRMRTAAEADFDRIRSAVATHNDQTMVAVPGHMFDPAAVLRW